MLKGMTTNVYNTMGVTHVGVEPLCIGDNHFFSQARALKKDLVFKMKTSPATGNRYSINLHNQLTKVDREMVSVWDHHVTTIPL
jgi:hypothetical protein